MHQPRLPDAATARAFHEALSPWFAAHGRSLAFRAPGGPWGVLVSEVMAQQTQVARVEAAWAAFMFRFPSPADLATATVADVLRSWAGMGYNRRALNLQRAAIAIVERHGGTVPGDVAALEALPGVGPYTARAVAAIAFGVPVAAVDTNIRRVVGRVTAGHGAASDPGMAPSDRDLQAVADALVDPADPARWTHAVMDLGALVCRPVAPDCGRCPLARLCRRRGIAGHLPGDAAARTRLRAVPRRDAGVPFPATRRWLRGRIVADLRDLPRGAWTEVAGPIGLHDGTAVGATLDALVGEGMVERRPDGAVRLPSAGR